MKKSLLFDSSIIFDNSNLVDNIRQSLIEIENELPSEEEVIRLFKEAVFYLDKDLTIETANELFSLILSCYSHYTAQLLPFFDIIFENSTKNSCHIIITVSILFYLNHINSLPSKNKYQSFIDDSISQLLPQIENSCANKIQLFDHEISPLFQTNLIINLLLLTELTQDTVKCFSPYLLTHVLFSDNPKIDLLFEKLIKKNLFFDVTDEILPKIIPKIDFSIESMIKYIPLLSVPTFKLIFPHIKKIISKLNSLSSTFSIVVLQKCSESDITLENIDKLIDNLTIFDLTTEIMDYLNRYEDYDFEGKFSEKLIDLPCLEEFPEDDMKRILFETEDLNFYMSFFPSIKKSHPVLSSPELWINIVSIASNSKEEISPEMNEQFRYYFQRFVKMSRFEEVLDGMIFSLVPQTTKGMNFIIQLVKEPKSKIRKNFLNDKNMDKLLLKVRETKIIPRSCFWQLFSRSLVFSEYIKDSNPLFLYGYLFASGGFEQDFDAISVMPQTERSKQDIYEYIKHDESKFEGRYELTNDMDEAAISLIACAFLFTRFEGIIPVNGISDEIILPFLAVSLDFSNSFFDKVEDRNDILVEILSHFKSNQPFSVLKKALKSLEKNSSPLLNISIDKILPYLYTLFSPEYFTFHIGLTVLQTLIPFFLKDEYEADKMLLLSTIFQFSHGEHELNKNVSCEVNKQISVDLIIIFRNNFTELFKFIINNLHEINSNKYLKQTTLNLAIFDETISSFIVDTIQNSPSTNEAIDFIYFIVNLCINEPKLQFQNNQRLESILEETIKDEKKKDASVVYQFMLKNGIGTDFIHLIKFPLLLSYLDPLSNQFLLEVLFNNMMKEESIQVRYLAILIQKVVNLSNKNYITPESIINNFSTEYQIYHDAFIKAVNLLLDVDQKNNCFVIKPDLTSSCESISEYGFTVISNIFESLNEKRGNCNAFIILKNIASSFPFLFENKSLQIFNSILPSLNHYPIIFDNDDNNIDEEKEMEIKTAISAISFLLSTLCSPKVLDDFFVWLFNNIKTFNDFQSLSFLIVLRSLMNIDNIKIVSISQMIKFNFIEAIKQIFQHNLPEGQFRNICLCVSYDLIESFYYSLRNLTQKDEIFIDELMKVECPFQASFSNQLVVFPGQQGLSLRLQLESSKLKDRIFNFVNEIEKIKPFWFNFEQKEKTGSTPDLLNSFISAFSAPSNETKRTILLKEIPRPLTNQMLHYLACKPFWISEWIDNHSSFILLHKHYLILDQVINDLVLIHKENKDDAETYNILNLYREKILFEKLVEKLDDHPFSTLCSLLVEISQKDTGLISILKCFNEILDNSSIDLKSIRRIIDILKKLSSSKGFKYDFIDICGNSLLDVILSPELRTKEDLLAEVSKLFSLLYSEMPNRIVHLIDYLLLFNSPTMIQNALVLSKKLGKKEHELLMPIITNLFDKLINVEHNMKYDEVSSILCIFPEVAIDRRTRLLKLLDNLLDNYRNQKDDFNDKDEKEREQSKDQMLNLIGSLFNILAPKRHQIKNIDSFEFSESHLIPNFIIESDPEFWRIFSKHYEQIIRDLYQDPLRLGTTVKFLLDYPELVEFNIRHSYFNEIKKKPSQEKVLEFNVNRMSILNDSMSQLNNLSVQDFLNEFQIQFVGERSKSGIGDFYRLLAKELFHPKNYYFIYTENRKSFQINPRSNLKAAHLDYFRFAGKIIARALLENEPLSIHLTSSLYKILLQLPFDLKDLKEIDRELFNSLEKKLNEDFTKVNANDEDDGMVFKLDLCGSDEEEEEEHEEEEEPQGPANQIYVNSEVDHRLKGQIKDQVKAFCDGFYMIIPFEQIKIFSPNELDLLVCGMPIIDVNDFKRNIELQHPYNDESPTVKLFFKAIEKWDQEKLSQLVLFITKSSQSIISGFRTLKENGNPIKIAPVKETDLPQSFPFINMLLLPDYDDEDSLNWKFCIAFNDAKAEVVKSNRIKNRKS